ncbi:hypothetical protein K458DRAFT_406912 [Lentithecium fluviatile CBS 122367]|uniref:Uncharacterized protein n=1 Tax=Lentithecium fluviatile CBS 122367 TaxID=1168545 RepID=A0A6G1IR69_9PLEO|nr:hypothetical protein K458DRAFT_406912 [Lentithecium fluviatile CBS 122367]
MYHWFRFKYTQPSCASGSSIGVERTSRLPRCERVDPSTSQKRSSQHRSDQIISRSWPGTTLPIEEASHITDFAQPSEQRTDSEQPSRNTIISPTSRHPLYLPLIRAPPRCRLPSSMRFTALLLYITLTLFLITTTSAIPLSISHARIHIQNRQSIPDRFGNTGNEPAPVASQPPPFTPTPSPTVTASFSSSITPSPSAAQPTSTLTTGSNGNSNNGGDNLGLNPSPKPPAEELQLTSPQLDLSPGALAGIIGGGIAILIITLALSIYTYRRLRTPAITEIPIRRSKLGSRLGRRIFGSLSVANSRSTSRASSRASLTGDGREKHVEAPGWLDKGMISRPKAAWLENGMLSVPKPAFAREERERVEEGERWVGKGAISAPRPGRPASAEPLGRLSGMGMGMGYLKCGEATAFG